MESNLSLNDLIGNADAMPDEIKPIIKMLIEGNVKQFVVAVEALDGTLITAFPSITDDYCPFRMVGLIESLKRDYMRERIQPRIEYMEKYND